MRRDPLHRLYYFNVFRVGGLKVLRNFSTARERTVQTHRCGRQTMTSPGFRSSATFPGFFIILFFCNTWNSIGQNLHIPLYLNIAHLSRVHDLLSTINFVGVRAKSSLSTSFNQFSRISKKTRITTSTIFYHKHCFLLQTLMSCFFKF